ncbi:cyclin-dependent kinase 16 [Planoprotostelium fungivorum]|uniref:Cyclin-dependent kinase 16 n=1 Tax=Planoprotostelium fungivorum TaxID=1890364 RepID=A0A2P6NM99_9EUKA|nr:cyclin-dependent kinase 16 [Planoprotostelium fungivorum]
MLHHAKEEDKRQNKLRVLVLGNANPPKRGSLEDRYECTEGWLSLPPEILLLICQYLDLRSLLVTFPLVCKYFYDISTQSTLLRERVWNRFLSHVDVPPENFVRHFRGWRHMIVSFLRRRKRCKFCDKPFNEFFYSRARVPCTVQDKQSGSSYKFHITIGQYVNDHPFRLDCSRPSESFRRLRNYLQNVIGIPHQIHANTKFFGGGNIRFDDDDTQVTLYDEWSITEYLRVLYFVENFAEIINMLISRFKINTNEGEATSQWKKRNLSEYKMIDYMQRTALRELCDQIHQEEETAMCLSSMRQVELVRNLSHPNVLKLIEAIQTPSHYHLVAEFVQSNRDVKPANIVVGNERDILTKRPEMTIDHSAVTVGETLSLCFRHETTVRALCHGDSKRRSKVVTPFHMNGIPAPVLVFERPHHPSVEIAFRASKSEEILPSPITATSNIPQIPSGKINMVQEITLDNFKALFPDVNQVKAAVTQANVEAILDDPTHFNINTIKKANVLGQLQEEGWFSAQIAPTVSNKQRQIDELREALNRVIEVREPTKLLHCEQINLRENSSIPLDRPVLRSRRGFGSGWDGNRGLLLCFERDLIFTIKLIEAIQTPCHHHLVAEFVQGVTLERYIEERGSTMRQNEVKCLFNQLAEGLAYCHKRGVSHRDVKPLTGEPPFSDVDVIMKGKVDLSEVVTMEARDILSKLLSVDRRGRMTLTEYLKTQWSQGG